MVGGRFGEVNGRVSGRIVPKAKGKGIGGVRRARCNAWSHHDGAQVVQKSSKSEPVFTLIRDWCQRVPNLISSKSPVSKSSSISVFSLPLNPLVRGSIPRPPTIQTTPNPSIFIILDILEAKLRNLGYAWNSCTLAALTLHLHLYHLLTIWFMPGITHSAYVIGGGSWRI